MDANMSIRSNYSVEFLNTYFEGLNSFNLFTTLPLIIFGLLGNSWSTLALVRLLFVQSKRRNSETMPTNDRFRLASNIYLLCFLVTNVALLLAHFYRSTINRIFFFMKIDHRTTDKFILNLLAAHVVDSNRLVCTICYYIRNSCRLLNAFSISLYSLDSFLHHYNLNSRRNCLVINLITGLFILPFSILFPLIFFTNYSIVDLKPSSENETFVGPRYISRMHLSTIVPTHSSRVCAFVKDDDNKYKLFPMTLGLVMISNLFFVVAMGSFLMKLSLYLLRKSRNDLVRLKSYRVNRPKGKFQTTFRLVLSNADPSRHVPPGARSGRLESYRDNGSRYKQDRPPTMSRINSSYYDRMAAQSAPQIRTTRPKRFIFDISFSSCLCHFNTFDQSSNMIKLVLSFLVYIVANFPYYFIVFFYNYKRKSSDDGDRSEYFSRVKMLERLTVLEVFQMFNYTLTFLFFYFTVRDFRRSFNDLIKKFLKLITCQ